MNPPQAVRTAVTTATEARPTSWQHFVAGHTHAEKWLVELPHSRAAFVKAATEASARAQIEREAFVLESVAAPYMPRLHGASTVDEWSVLVLEDLSSAQWPPPYADRGAALLDTIAQVAATPLRRDSIAGPKVARSGRIGNESEPIRNPCSLTDCSPQTG